MVIGVTQGTVLCKHKGKHKGTVLLCFKRIASSYVYWYNWKYKRNGHLFQDRFKSEPVEDEWVDTDEFPGQLAVDVYETADKLVVKARTAGISKSDLDVSISDNILTISGVLSGGEDEQTTRWHIQECYWGEFSRTIALPVQVREDENSVKAELKDGVLTIMFEKEKTEAPKKIEIQ